MQSDKPIAYFSKPRGDGTTLYQAFTNNEWAEITEDEYKAFFGRNKTATQTENEGKQQ